MQHRTEKNTARQLNKTQHQTSSNCLSTAYSLRLLLLSRQLTAYLASVLSQYISAMSANSSEPLSEATNVKALHALCQQTVAQENRGEPREICPGQRLQANHGAERRKRNADADSHNHNRHQQNRQRGAALEERYFFGSQHMYHQGLRKQSLNQPEWKSD